MLDDGFPIKKSQAQRWIHQERNRLRESYLDIFHEPGQMVQFDWGTKRLSINGRNHTVCFAVFAFPYSNYRYVYVTGKMDGRSFVEAFIAFTKHIGGVYPILLIDNMKIAAQHKKYRDQQPQLTSLFLQLESHYNMEVRLCTPYRPNKKGTVENAVKTLKTHLLKKSPAEVSLHRAFLQSICLLNFRQTSGGDRHQPLSSTLFPIGYICYSMNYNPFNISASYL